MKAWVGALTLVALWAGSSVEPAWGRAQSKVSVRTSQSLLNNANTGAALSFGGLSLQYGLFVLPQLALQVGYRAEFDYAAFSVPLHGPDVGARYYFWGSGAQRALNWGEGEIEKRNRFNFYATTELGLRFFYLGGNTQELPDTTLTGSFAIFGAGAGMDVVLTPVLDLNVELNGGFLPFAASDNRIRVQAYSLIVGVSFLW
jgi:hypothetical protein